jgi:hypothetical protein
MRTQDWLDEGTLRELRPLGVDTGRFSRSRPENNPIYFFEEKKKFSFREELYEQPRKPSRHSSDWWVNPRTGELVPLGLSHSVPVDAFGGQRFDVFPEKPREEWRDLSEKNSLTYLFEDRDRRRKENLEPYLKKFRIEDKRERDEWCGLTRSRDSLGFSQDSLRLLGRELHPFLYDSTQDGRVVETALRVVQDPRFVELEARALAPNVSPGARPDNLAERRYEGVVVPALASTMAGFAWQRGLAHLGGKSSSVSLDSVEAVRDQINQVNFCPEQVRGIIAHGKVRDAYVVGVSPRAEDLALSSYRI